MVGSGEGGFTLALGAAAWVGGVCCEVEGTFVVHVLAAEVVALWDGELVGGGVLGGAVGVVF